MKRRTPASLLSRRVEARPEGSVGGNVRSGASSHSCASKGATFGVRSSVSGASKRANLGSRNMCGVSDVTMKLKSGKPQYYQFSEEQQQPQSRMHSRELSVFFDCSNLKEELDDAQKESRSCEDYVHANMDSRSQSAPKQACRCAVHQQILRALSRAVGLTFRTDRVQLATRIECALYDYFSRDSKEYVHKARSVVFNLNDPKNVDFVALVAVGFLAPSDVPKLTAEQMSSIDKVFERARIRKSCMEEVQADWDAKRTARVDGVLTCEKCGSSKTDHFQLQTRSADEPMTTYVMCIGCGDRWKC